jgi:hypothetical protein
MALSQFGAAAAASASIYSRIFALATDDGHGLPRTR